MEVGKTMHRAQFYEKDAGRVNCLLCPRGCKISEGQEGFCGVRRVVEGELYTTNYGRCSAIHWDPIEKKPLYHFFPGRPVLSLGTYGCNFLCSFCQNWSLARSNPDRPGAARQIEPAQVLAMLQGEGGPQAVLGAAFTYNEPTVWYEFVYDTARLLREHGYRNVLVTNGYISRAALKRLLPYIDALNIDVKGFSDAFYKRYCRGARSPVMETVELASACAHVEVTCLLIPTLNDDPQELAQLTNWLAGISPDLPLHFSRYFPQYKLKLPPTPLETMQMARDIALKKLRYVYLGNVDLPGAADTCCPRCRNLLIRRSGYQVRISGLKDNLCLKCREKINLVS